MADGLRKAAVWLGLMSDNRYAGDEVSQEITQLVDSPAASDHEVLRPLAAPGMLGSLPF